MDETMKDWWSVNVDADVDAASEEVVEDLLEVLPDVGGSSPALSWGPGELSVRFSVQAQEARRAMDLGLHAFQLATEKLGIGVRGVSSIEATSHERLEQELDQAGEFEQYVGVSEIAAMLGVSKQRVSELRSRADFPAPVAELAAGPVWRRWNLQRFVVEWPRRPGQRGTLLQALQELRDREALAGADLTEAQLRVLARVRTGVSLKELAEELGVTDEAVRAHLRRILGKVQRSMDEEPAPAGAQHERS